MDCVVPFVAKRGGKSDTRLSDRAAMQTDTRMPWVIVVPRPQQRNNPPTEKSFTGDGHEILLQGFHWDSHAGVFDGAQRKKKNWYSIMHDNAGAIKAAGFS